MPFPSRTRCMHPQPLYALAADAPTSAQPAARVELQRSRNNGRPSAASDSQLLAAPIAGHAAGATSARNRGLSSVANGAGHQVRYGSNHRLVRSRSIRRWFSSRKHQFQQPQHQLLQRLASTTLGRTTSSRNWRRNRRSSFCTVRPVNVVPGTVIHTEQLGRTSCLDHMH